MKNAPAPPGSSAVAGAAAALSAHRTLGELADAVGGEVHGDRALPISGVNGLAEAAPGELSFFNNPRYKAALAATRASAVLVGPGGEKLVGARAAVVVFDPYLAFAKVSAVFHPRPAFKPGIDPRAAIDPSAEVDPSATVMPFAYVGAGAKVGPRAVLFPSAFVGEGSRVGEDCVLYPCAVVREGCSLGDRSILQPGAVIGADGFGYAFDLEHGEHFKIPQAGVVEVDSDVEIGANSAVDRATLGATRVGKGAKLDNLVQVGHNVQVGPLAILCGQVGIAGSSKLGQGVVLGGQAGIANHVTLADGVRVGAQSGVMADVEEAGDYIGSPIVPVKEWFKQQAAVKRTPDMVKALQRLTRQVAALEAKLEALQKK